LEIRYERIMKLRIKKAKKGLAKTTAPPVDKNKDVRYLCQVYNLVGFQAFIETFACEKKRERIWGKIFVE
jgi:hypothetical protein